MLFEVNNRSHNNATFKRINQRAAARQTEEQRQAIFDKYERLVGKAFKNRNAARRAAMQELKSIPEYWDEDQTPRRPLKPSSSAIASIQPYAGAVFVAFKSNPSKKYYYPVGMGTAETAAKAAEELVTADSIGKFMSSTWRHQHALPTKRTKKGNLQYQGKIFSLSKLSKGKYK